MPDRARDARSRCRRRTADARHLPQGRPHGWGRYRQRRSARSLPAGDPPGWRVMRDFFRVAWHVMRKDMTVEIRSREILFTTVLFAVSVVLIFSFAIVREGRAPDDVAAGILWVAISFAGTLAMGRTFERE